MIKRLSLLLVVALAALLSEAQPITAGQHTRVETVYGTIEGYKDGGVFTFKGIQYAKAERFMPPQAPDKFSSIRQCKVFGPQAPQGESLKWNTATARRTTDSATSLSRSRWMSKSAWC